MSETFTCIYCGREFSGRQALRNHHKISHPDIRRPRIGPRTSTPPATPQPAAPDGGHTRTTNRASAGRAAGSEYGRQPDYNALVDARAENAQLRRDLAPARAALATAEGERDELRAVAKATRDTLTVIDEWLGMASTREAAIDSMRRLERMLSAVGFEYIWKGILDWRGSLVDELWNARFYAGPDHHWHYVPGDPEPKFGNAAGPELAEIVSVMENALRDRATMSIALEQETNAHDALANALADILGHTLVGDDEISAIATAALRQHAPGLLADGDTRLSAPSAGGSGG